MHAVRYDDPNLLLLTDSYKLSHAAQYPKGSQTVYSHIMARGGEFPGTVWFGLQAILETYLAGQVVTREKIAEARSYFKAHGTSYDLSGWEYILREHGGRLPLHIRAVPEGTYVPTRNVLMSVYNLDPNCHWLTSYVEGLLMHVWYPTTVCTLSYFMKRMIGAALSGTSDNVDGLPYKLHDFGFRGASSVETAAIGGAAHLVNFLGTDTIPALRFLRHHYSLDGMYDTGMPGYSCNATEHSTITSHGRENELQAYRQLLETFPTGLLACVSDSYNIYEACEKMWGGELRDMVLKRDGVLIIRPDSGEPREVLPKLLRILDEKFGSRINSKGYRVLNDKVRLIQGDGIRKETLGGILIAIEEAGYSIDNLAFGMGGGLLQRVDRDTCKFAMKCSAIYANGEWRDVYKDPVDDAGKISKRGILRLDQTHGGNYLTSREPYPASSLAHPSGDTDLLWTVFMDGECFHRETLDQIRQRVPAFDAPLH